MLSYMIEHKTSRTGAVSLTMTGLTLLLAGMVVTACGDGEEPVPPPQIFRATLSSLNTGVHGDTISGTVTLDVSEDSVRIRIDATGLPPGMTHLAHYHGFVDSVEDAYCPGVAADTNNDTIVDLIETQAVSGVTMVPFHNDPVSLEIQAEGYPTADSAGNLTYEKTIGLTALKSALSQKFGIDDPRFSSRVVYLHGVSPDNSLPASVASLPDVPAHVTLPIACGRFIVVAPKEEVGVEEAQDVGASGY